LAGFPGGARTGRSKDDGKKTRATGRLAVAIESGGSDWNAQARTSATMSTFASHSPTAKNRKGERRQKVRTSAGRTGVTPKRDRLENGKSRQRGAASVC